MPSIELVDTFADDSLEMDETGAKFRVATELQDKIAANDTLAKTHAARHADGGPDELSVTGLSGKLADAQTALAHKASHQDGGADEIVVTGLSGLLADPQTAGGIKTATTTVAMAAAAAPVAGQVPIASSGTAAAWGAPVPAAHKASHQLGGADEINVTNLTGRLKDRQTADMLWSGGNVSLLDIPPTVGQVLTATGTAAAAWQTPSLVNPAVNGFRLSTSNTDPLSSNGTFSTVYLTPYNGNAIALYDGSAWNIRRSGGASQVLAGLTADRPADIFAFDNGGVVATEMLSWASATARTTAIVRQDGVWVKSGAPTRRYLGTILGSTATTIIHSSSRCAIWNVSNRVDYAFEQPWPTTDTTLATANTWYQIGAALDLVMGVTEDWLSANILGLCRTENSSVVAAIGLDGANPVGLFQNVYVPATNTFVPVGASARLQLVGYHRLAEYIRTSNTAAVFVAASGNNSAGLAIHLRY